MRQVLPQPSQKAVQLRAALQEIMVGQEKAIDAVVEAVQWEGGRNKVGGQNLEGPIASLLFLGPTGTGKTKMVEALAEILHKDRMRFIKINCGEYTHGHEVAKLVGAPPGYLGHRESTPQLSQSKLSSATTEGSSISLILFDEIEKAHEDLFDLLLNITDKGRVTLGDNTTVNFNNSIIFLTSNLGTRQVADMLAGKWGLPAETTSTTAVDTLSMGVVKRFFRPEFFNRLTDTVVFRSFTPMEMSTLVRREVSALLGDLRELINISDAVYDYLVAKGTDGKYGARFLKRTIQTLLVRPAVDLADAGMIDWVERKRVNVEMYAGDIEWWAVDNETAEMGAAV